ncbi:MAG: peptidoglycan DD-metalloendopeptidase family protein [Vallitaleaceae bacterium]|jgi:murein DD-endopeptidase MepM/ murein hydrolase activator NlpD|nr:peptidoglycan DD-metalloendopeptidase family protein [Vallitaleaceae bacterium]
MKKQSRIIFIIFFSILLIVQTPLEVSASDSYGDLQQKIKDWEYQEEENEAAREQTLYEIELTKEYLSQIYGRLDIIEQNILAADAEIEAIENQILQKNEEIKLTQEALNRAIIEEADYHEQVADRLMIMYEYGEVGYWEVLLESENLGDFFTRLEYLSQIFNYDEKMFDKLEEMQESIIAQETQMEIEQMDMDIILSELELKKVQAEALYADKASEMAVVEENQLMLDMQIAFQEEEEERINEGYLKAVEAMENYLQWSDGELDWPAPGQTRITSNFGMRVHPITGVTKQHNGLDIGMPYGTTIVAAETGTVIRANYSSSYGNVVMISHGTWEGHQYFTLYAHNSKLLVVEGQTVLRGDPISQAGSTGWSTGVHLHFGVMKDTTWVNPLYYFEKN